MSDDEEDVYDALGELYRSGDVDMSVGGGGGPRFSLTERGDVRAESLLKSNDEALLFFLHIHLNQIDKPGDSERVAKATIELGEWVRDELGRNLFRVLQRYPEKVNYLEVDELPEDFVEQFEPESDGENA